MAFVPTLIYLISLISISQVVLGSLTVTLMDKRPANMSMDKGQNRDVALGRVGASQSHLN